MVAFCVNDVAGGGDAHVAFGLHSTLQRNTGVVLPEMFLACHALDGGIFLVPDVGDIQQDIRAPLTLLRLMGFEAVHRRGTNNFFARLVTFCLGDDARFLSQVHR
ncbi:hypothetical protein D3C78_1719330 [compost metagenome]